MAAENCSVADPWPHHLSDAFFARDNETLDRAIWISISNSDDFSAAIASPDTPSPFLLFNQIAAYEMTGRRRVAPATGRVAKRKSRASKRTPTTYINADPASFREMVQRVTGARTNADVGEPDGRQLPLPLQPSVEIRAVPDLQQMCLPTLDTSAFLLDRAGTLPSGNGDDFFGPAAVDGPGSDIDAFLPSFPTLESWAVV